MNKFKKMMTISIISTILLSNSLSLAMSEYEVISGNYCINIDTNVVYIHVDDTFIETDLSINDVFKLTQEEETEEGHGLPLWAIIILIIMFVLYAW